MLRKQEKQWVSLCTVFFMFCVMFIFPMSTSAAAYINDTFEDANGNNTLTGWTQSAKDAAKGNDMTVVSNIDTHTNCLDVTTGAGSGTPVVPGTNSATRTFTPLSGKVVVSFDIKFDNGFIAYVNDSTGKSLVAIAPTWIKNGTSAPNPALAINTWYNLKFIIDTDSDTFSFYKDGTLFGTGYKFNIVPPATADTLADNVGQIWIQSGRTSPATASNVYIDNLQAYNDTSYDNPNDTFEDISSNSNLNNWSATYNEPANGNVVQVANSIYGHSNSLKVAGVTKGQTATRTFASKTGRVAVEIDMLYTDVSKFCTAPYIKSSDGKILVAIMSTGGGTAGKLYIRNGANTVTTGVVIQNNTWCHYKVVINTGTSTFDIYLDNILLGSGYGYMETPATNNVSKIDIGTTTASNTHYVDNLQVYNDASYDNPNDTFEDISGNSGFVNWSATSNEPANGNVVQVANNIYGHSNSLKVAGVTKAQTATRTFAPKTGTVVVELDMLYTDVSKFCLASYIKSSDGKILVAIMSAGGGTAGKLWIRNGANTVTTGVVIQNNTWCHYKVVINTGSSTFDIYLDNNLLGSGYSYMETPTTNNVSKIDIGTTTASNTHYVDNVVVRQASTKLFVSSLGITKADGAAITTFAGLNSIKANVTVGKDTTNAGNFTVILVVYNQNNQMVTCTISPKSIIANNYQVTFSDIVLNTFTGSAGYYAKAFVWDSITGMQPYGISAKTN